MVALPEVRASGSQGRQAVTWVDEVLYWISARGAGDVSWNVFRDRSQRRAPDTVQDPQRLCRYDLELFGHALFDRQRGLACKVREPALVALAPEAGAPSGLFVGFCVGWRTPALADRIADAAGRHGATFSRQSPNPDAASCWTLQAKDYATLRRIADDCGLCYKPDASACILAGLEEVEHKAGQSVQALLRLDGDEAKWLCTRSRPAPCWMPAPADPHEWTATPGRLFRLDRANRGQAPAYYMRTDNTEGWEQYHERGWGVYRALHCARRRVWTFRAEEGGSGKLCMPMTCRPPIEVERAFVLSLGKRPLEDNGMLCYHVPRRIAEFAAGLLDQGWR